jgi:hypothetical protein
MDMKVTQTDSELTYTRTAERDPREDMSGGGGQRRPGGGMGGMASGDMSSTFDLSGKETTAPGAARGSVKLKAKSKSGSMELTQTREFEGRMGSMKLVTVETWKLSEDGNTLTVSSKTETPRGSRNSTMVFVREDAEAQVEN